MKTPLVSKGAVVVGAGVALFAVNNLVLAKTLTRLPGGTVFAATDMLVVGALSLRMAPFPTIAVIYATYGLLGLLGHLGVDPSTYVRHLPWVVGAALVYDGIVAASRYRWWGLVGGMPVFACLVLSTGGHFPAAQRFLTALALAWVGLGVGILVSGPALRRRREERPAWRGPRGTAEDLGWNEARIARVSDESKEPPPPKA
jgi:hypothetical protein